MSYFDEASLVMIPSGYKNQKVYSVKPLDGSGDLTFSRASSATRVASNGLIEKVRTNLALYSEQFNEATWNKFNNATATANTTTAPNGTTTADTYGISTAATTFPNISQDLAATNGITYTFSVYAKKNVTNFVKLRVGGTAFSASTNSPMFNLNTGVVTSGTGTIESVGNGWYRCSFKETAGATATGGFAIDLPDANGVWSGSSVYTASDSVFIWGFQTEVSDFGATPYIATTSAAVSVGPVSGLPRLDYLNSTCPRLILEPQRTNLALYSEQLNNAAWAATRAAFTANQTVAPDGYTSADLYTDGTFTGNVSFIEQSVVVGGSGTTYSVFVKKGTANFVQFGFYDTDFHGFVVNTTTWATTHTFGSASSFTATNYGNGWYRLSMYKAAASNTIFVSVAVAANSTGANYNGTGALTAYFWGAQIEAANSTYATSYIPTLGTSVTRVADAASKTSASALIGQTEGTIFWEIDVKEKIATGSDNLLNLDNGSFGDTIYLFKVADGRIACDIFNDGNQQASFILPATSWNAGVVKMALGYANNNCAFFVNGVQVGTTDTSCTIPTMTQVQLGLTNVGGAISRTAQLLLFKTRLTNESLAALTSL